MIKITYPGTGNYSTFTYDGLSRNAIIVETASGSVTSTKQFVWNNTDRSEQRDASSAVTAQFFSLGEILGGIGYFYTTDHLGCTAVSAGTLRELSVMMLGGYLKNFNPLAHSGSIREMTNSTGGLQSENAFDLYGRESKLQGTINSDMQFAGYYAHSRSSLNLTLTRCYSPSIGRWLNRDPIGEIGGANLYSYSPIIPFQTLILQE